MSNSTIRGSRGKYPYDVGKHLMAVLDLYAYADESGVEKTPPYCVVAGYIASPKTWKTFRTAWSSMVTKYQIGELHAKKFFGRNPGHGEYAHLSRMEASAFLNEAINVITSHRINPIGSIVDVGAFNRLTLGERMFLTGVHPRRKGSHLPGSNSPNQPYYVPFRMFVQLALDYTPMGTKVHFVFDQQGQRAGLSLEMFEDMKAHNSLSDNGRLGDLIFVDSKEKVEIQAADMFSHLTYRYFKAKNKLGKMNPEYRTAMGDLLVRKQVAIAMVDADALEKSLAMATPEFRAYLHSVTS